jgi:tripartite-type tricarboxylate transporter receptor subunit TctC
MGEDARHGRGRAHRVARILEARDRLKAGRRAASRLGSRDRGGRAMSSWLGHVVALLLGLYAVGGHAVAGAEEPFPSRPLTLVVGFAPGGGIDINARLLAKALSPYLGQPVIVENRPGAGSKIANDHVAKSRPDGYTLLVTTAAIAIDMALGRNAGVEREADFVPVSTISTTPMILAVKPSLPVASVRALVARARARPGEMNYSSSGTGTTGHLYAELFKLRTATDIVHVPYKGNAPSLNALLAGDVDMTFATMPSVLPLVKAGRVRALATTGGTRSPLLPDLPTMKEAGIDDVEENVWYGLLAPAATPPEVIATLARAVAEVSRSRDFRHGLRALGVEPSITAGPEFRALVQREVARWAEVARVARIESQ